MLQAVEKRRMRFKSLVETVKPTKFKKGVRHKINIKTIILKISTNGIGI